MLLSYHKKEYKALLYKDIFSIYEGSFSTKQTNFGSIKYCLLFSKRHFFQPMDAHDFNAIALPH